METNTLKECNVCNRTLQLDSFAIQKLGKHGRRASCKECVRDKYVRTKEGTAYRIYRMQVAKSKKRNYTPPAYTKEELKEWLYTQESFHKCYDKWVAGNYQKDDVPSVDRINDYISYRLDNIRVIPWEQHKNRYYSDAIRGDNTKSCKAVDKLDMNGKFIKRFHSVSAAARDIETIPVNVRLACIGKYKQCKGFKYRWSTKSNINSEIKL